MHVTIKSPKVFISYAWANQPLTRRLQADLQRDGVEVFVDYQRIEGGDSLPARISEALDWCDTLILLWSDQAKESYWVKQEWENAFHMQKRIIPCVLDNARLPALLRSRLYLDFSSYQTGYAHLCRTLGVTTKLDQPASPKAKTKSPMSPNLAESEPLSDNKSTAKKYFQQKKNWFSEKVKSHKLILYAAMATLAIFVLARVDWQLLWSYRSQKKAEAEPRNTAIRDSTPSITLSSTSFTTGSSTLATGAKKRPAPEGMVLIPAGSFMMGSDSGSADEKPVHEVYVEGKIIGSERMNLPAIHVSWNDAKAIARWKRKHLPTEAEWEYAARSGSKAYKYSWGNGNPMGKKGGNIADESAKRSFNSWPIWQGYDDGFVFTAPVKSFAPNEFKLYDMTGNVWEWCEDRYDGKYYEDCYKRGIVRNPKGPTSGDQRVLRGGSWDDVANGVRCAGRGRGDPAGRDSYAGFRCVQDVR